MKNQSDKHVTYYVETKYESMYKAVLAGLCANSVFSKYECYELPERAKRITDAAFKILDENNS